MEQMKGIKFHSNYARMYCGIFFLLFGVLHLIDNKFYGLVLLAVIAIVFIICLVIKVKVVIGESGIYSPKSDLLLLWEEIKGVNHVAIDGTEAARTHFIIHNPITLIIHQKEHLPN